MAFQLRSKEGCVIRKNDKDVFASDVSVEVKIEQLDEKSMSFVAVASTEDEDRSKDIIYQDGWILNNFKKNSVVPLNHDYYSLPVAKSLRTWISKTNGKPKLMFKPKFDESDDKAVQVFNKYKNGFLTSFSVGFIPHDVKYRDEQNWWSGGREFLKQELLEISCVTVPDNPNASVMFGFGNEETMLSCGYSEYFTKTSDGNLYYPIKDIVLYTKPEIVKLNDHVSVFKAKKIADESDNIESVAYMFDSSEFDANSVRDWLYKNYTENTEKKTYYSFVIDEQKQIKLDKVEEEASVEFDKEFVDIDVTIDTNDDITDVDSSVKEITTDTVKAIIEAIDAIKGEQKLLSEKVLAKLEELVDNKKHSDDNNSDDNQLQIDTSIFEIDKSIKDESVDLSGIFDSDVTKEKVKEKISEMVRTKIDDLFNTYGKIE